LEGFFLKQNLLGFFKIKINLIIFIFFLGGGGKKLFLSFNHGFEFCLFGTPRETNGLFGWMGKLWKCKIYGVFFASFGP
jgi:hypothetical protein